MTGIGLEATDKGGRLECDDQCRWQVEWSRVAAYRQGEVDMETSWRDRARGVGDPGDARRD
jgi:hypothetical protein